MATTMRVHRCSFVDWVPDAVQVLAFDPDGAALAVARGNGNVELWSRNDSWAMRARVCGGEGLTIRRLAWVRMPSGNARLYAGTLQGALLEVDFPTLSFKHATDTGGGAAWSLAARPSARQLAVGCEDGGIRLYDVSDVGISYSASFTRTDARVLSLAWHPDGSLLFSGGADGFIRAWDPDSGTSSMRMAVENFGGPATHVWDLRVLRDLTLVSADSLGHVQFWDGATGTMQQSFNQLAAQALCLAVSEDETSVFAAGVDPKIIHIRRVAAAVGVLGEAATGASELGSTWVYSASQRQHTHDVNAVALAGSGAGSVLVSGGVDTQLVVHSVARFEAGRATKVPPFSPRVVRLAPGPRVLLVQHARRLEMWALGRTPADVVPKQSGAHVPLVQSHRHLVDIKLKGGRNTVCSALAADASLVACADPVDVKLFSVRLPLAGHATIVCRIALPASISDLPVRDMVFSPSAASLILATATRDVVVVDVRSRAVVGRMHHAPLSGDEDEAAPLTTLAVSQDGQWVAAADAGNCIHVFNLDTLQLHCTLPVFPALHSALAFHAAHPSLLLVATAANTLHAFDVERRALTDWSRANSAKLAAKLGQWPERVTGLAVNPAAPFDVALYSHSHICFLSMKAPMPAEGAADAAVAAPAAPAQHEDKAQVQGRRGKKRKAQEQAGPPASADAAATPAASNGSSVTISGRGEEMAVKVVGRFQPLLFMGFVAGNEAAVVETPWLRIMQHFPDVLYRPKFGS